MTLLSSEEAHAILALRLLIARAANTDSLAWWEDESLTPHAAFVLERTFPMAPPLAARSLALTAALARHQAACSAHNDAVHLYHLDADGQDKLALRDFSLLPIAVPQEPIETIAALQQHMVALIGGPWPCTALRRTDARGLQIQIPSSPDRASPLFHRARTLAWAYLQGAPEEPVFPFFLERTS